MAAPGLATLGKALLVYLVASALVGAIGPVSLSEPLDSSIADILPDPSPRPPIVITRNEDFTLANGVVEGRGTAASPYVIEGWLIERKTWEGVAPAQAIGISISGTTAHVHVVGNTVVDYATGISVASASNVRIVDNVVRDVAKPGAVGILLSGAKDARVASNVVENRVAAASFSGIRVVASTNVNATDNVVTSAGATSKVRGLDVETTSGVTAARNRFILAAPGGDAIAYRFLSLSKSRIEANTLAVSGAGSGTSLSGFVNEQGASNTFVANNADGAVFNGFLSKNSQQTVWKSNAVGTALFGLVLNESRGEILDSNTLSTNRYNFALQGAGREHFVHDIRPTNLAGGYPLAYHVGLRDRVLDGGHARVGWLGVVDARNVTVKNFEVAGSGWQGVVLVTFHDSRAERLQALPGVKGLEVLHSSNCRVSRSNLSSVVFVGTFNCALDNSTVSAPRFDQRSALRIATGSTYTAVSDVVIRNATIGIELASGPANVVTRATLSGNALGVRVLASGNRVTASSIAGNAVGAYAFGATLDASGNWWGSVTGPSGKYPGTGDPIDWWNGSIAISPALAAPP